MEQIGLDGSVLAFTALLTLVTTVLFGLAPLLASGSVDLEAMLRQGSGRFTAGRRQHRVRQAMVVTTVAAMSWNVLTFYREGQTLLLGLGVALLLLAAWVVIEGLLRFARLRTEPAA